MKAALYIRVSTAMQVAEGWSLEAQERVLREHCKSKEMEIYEVYRDAGISGKNITERPGVQALLSDALLGKFNTVIVWKLNRLTRSLKDLLNICDLLEAHDVFLASYSEPFDNSTPAGRLLRAMIGVVAEFERETISENIKSALLEKAVQGQATTGFILGYDYSSEGKQLHINEEEAEVVQFIFGAYVKLKCLLSVAEACKSLGLLGKRGFPIQSAQQVKTILTRKTYCGYNCFLEEWYQGSHDPIIPLGTFEKVQQILIEQGYKKKSG